MRKYPIGLQSFKEIRNGNYVYVDKTQKIFELISTGKYYFLSRPRRFGKSLLLSTIKEIYLGNKALFKDLWIENQWDWTNQNPVIHIQFASLGYAQIGLEAAILLAINENAKELNIEITNQTIGLAFKELIQKANETTGRKAVILIDEYDKPILDYLLNLEQAYKNRDILKSFYSILKDNDDNIEFLILTGVGKFTKVSIFSDLNNLQDITIGKQFSSIIGITQNELETNFSEEIKSFKIENINILNNLKTWYNGYSWGANETVYNPFSILNFIKTGEFKIFWFETGTPSFLIEQIKKNQEFQFEETKTDLIGLSDLDYENLNPTTLLFQTGYLTIADYNQKKRIYTLKYPNREVEQSLLSCLLAAYGNSNTQKTTPLVVQISDAFEENNIEKVVKIVNTLFSTIPYDLWRNATELHYHALTHLIFTLLGTYIESEVHTSDGRCDMIVKTETHIFALEFKLDESAEIALKQITDKEYLAPYQLDERTKVAIGISFSSELKKIQQYLLA